jgi:hypothetical protein
MSIWTKLVERRKHKRFQAPTCAFAGVGPDFTKVGRPRDISMGGVAFSYVGREEPSTGSYLDLFMTDSDFYLGHLPINAIFDCELVNKAPSSSAGMRRCAVKFGKMTRSQKSRLAYFIHNHTVGEA